MGFSTHSTTSADPYLETASSQALQPIAEHGSDEKRVTEDDRSSNEPSRRDEIAAFLKNKAADETSESHSELLSRPPVPGEPPYDESNIRQPMRLSEEADKPDAFNGPPADELNRLIDKAHPYVGESPTVFEHDIVKSGLSKYDPKSEEGQAPGNSTEKVPGYVPKDPARLTRHPEYADYKQRRPEQLLSHFSSVMLYHAEKEKTNAVEVQFGYLQDGNETKLYSSANSYKGQQWLTNNSSGKKLLNRVKDAARQNENLDVKRHALKLLYFEENQKARRADIDNDSSLSNADKKRAHNDLDLTDKLHKEFFTGTHHVVTNTIAAEKEPQAGKKKAGESNHDSTPAITKKADKMWQRHAEQNVAEQMHFDMNGRKAIAEIAGTKIRCGSCNTAIGPSIKDRIEGYHLAGQYYVAQAARRDMEANIDEVDRDGNPVSKSSVASGARSRSTSPGRGLGDSENGVNDNNAYYGHRKE